MKKHLEVLDLLAAGKISNQDPRVEEALREAVAFCRGALPLDEREESAIVSRAAYRVAESGTQHASDVAQMVKKERAQAHAAGYAKAMRQRNEAHESDVQSYSDERARLIPENLSLTAQLSAAQAEIAKLSGYLDTYESNTAKDTTELKAAQAEIKRITDMVFSQSKKREDVETKLSAAQAEIDRLRGVYAKRCGEIEALETKLTNLRTAAEQHLTDNPIGNGVFKFRAAIKESR